MTSSCEGWSPHVSGIEGTDHTPDHAGFRFGRFATGAEDAPNVDDINEGVPLRETSSTGDSETSMILGERERLSVPKMKYEVWHLV